MAGSESTENGRVTATSADTDDEAALEEFKAGLVRSMKQYNAGLVKTFDDVDDFLNDLHNPD
jgi:hypothetical protein